MATFDFISARPATVFLFPGQGSQAVGMVADVLEAYPAAWAAMEEADDVLGYALSDIWRNGPAEQLTDTVNAQPALLAASVAVMRAVEAELAAQGKAVQAGTAASMVAGHSMGEYSALVAAGSVSYADALRLVHTRGRLMKEAGERNPGMMAAILGLDEQVVAQVCADATERGGLAQVANDNCPGQIVISGDRPGMEAAMAALTAAGARKVVPLAVSIAAHSPLMAPAADALRSAIEATPVQDAAVPLLANTSAVPITKAADIRTELTAQLTGSVRWTESMQYALAQGMTHFVELGAGDVLATLMKRIDRKVERRAVNNVESVLEFVATVGV